MEVEQWQIWETHDHKRYLITAVNGEKVALYNLTGGYPGNQHYSKTQFENRNFFKWLFIGWDKKGLFQKQLKELIDV